MMIFLISLVGIFECCRVLCRVMVLSFIVGMLVSVFRNLFVGVCEVVMIIVFDMWKV